MVAFKHPQNSKIEACDGEQYWNANTIHHRHECYIQDIAVLEVDDEFGSKINIKVLVDLGCFRDVSRSLFRCPFLVTFPFKHCDQIRDHLGKHRNEGVKDHGLCNSITNNSIPQRNEIIEGSIKDPADSWSHFPEISIHKQE